MLRSPSMNSWPTSRSLGPRTTELRLPLAPFSAGAASGVCCLLAGRLVLKVTHPNVAVQRGAIVDLEPANGDVAAEPRVLRQGQLVARRHGAFDLALERHAVAFE